MGGIISFERLQHIVPEEGSLTLKITRKGKGKLQVLYSPKYKGKEDKEELSPLLLTGTPEELEEDFDKVVRELVPLEKMLAGADKVAERKKALEGSVSGQGKKQGQGSTADDGGLFAKKKGKAAKKKETPPAGPETSAPAEEGTAEGETCASGAATAEGGE
jgi:PRTRC genetic system protein E